MRFLIRKINTSLIGGAFLIATFGFLSKLLGLVRDRLLALFFGASSLSDVYFASFRIPDLIFNIFVLGALTSSFIPVFQKVWLHDREAGIRLSNSVLNLLTIGIGILSVFLFFAAGWIVPLMVPGFTPAQLQETIAMTRIMLTSVIFLTASNVVSGILNSWRKFFSFSISPVVYNLGIIFGIVVLYPLMGLRGLAWGVVCGSIAHFCVQLIEVIKNGWRYSIRVTIDSNVRKIFYLMLPRMFGLASLQISNTVITFIASYLAAGSLAAYSYAQNLQSFPVSIFGISLAIAAFPVFTQSLSNNDTSHFQKVFSIQFRRILFFLVPLSFTLLILRAHIVRVILGSGAFDWDATRMTAQALGYFALSIVGQGLQPLLTRSFYAFENTRTPVAASTASNILNIILAILLAPRFGVVGLALAFSISSIFNTVILFWMLHRHFGNLDDDELFNSLARIVTIATLSAAIMYLSLRITAPYIYTRTFVGIFLHGSIAGTFGLTAYMVLSILLKLPEVGLVRSWISKFRNNIARQWIRD